MVATKLWVVILTVVSASDYSSFMNIYVSIYTYSECICIYFVYIFKKQVHCKKLELNLLCQHDILLAEDVLFMDTSYGCYGNRTAMRGLVCGAVQGRRHPPRAAPPASPHPLWSWGASSSNRWTWHSMQFGAFLAPGEDPTWTVCEWDLFIFTLQK